jgi:hypothetical protein
MLKLDELVMVKKLLMLTRFKTSCGLVIFQEWVVGFNVNNPKGMTTPTWITLRKLLVEFQSVGGEIATRLGTMLRFDKAIIQVVKQQFFVASKVGDGWETSMVVENEAMGETVLVLIDYDFLPIQCRFCLKSSHRVKDCSNLASLKDKFMKV